ncbi:MAG TPA: phosphatase PAP2 family protein [Candidatus Eisenbacteria bacterium]|nr:phosphatase PAP2 family protein [Candidatus Eisenbacteria bacterium]
MRRAEWVGLGLSRRVHVFMACVYGTLLSATTWGLWTRSGSGWQGIALTSAVIFPVVLLPAIVYNDLKSYEKRHAALTLPWVVLLVAIIPSMAVLSVRFEFPLRDALLAKMDRALGFNVPAIAAWTAAHPHWRTLSDKSYDVLYLLLPMAMFLPGILGKRAPAEQFIVANAAAFLLSFPVFTLMPAIGPWAGSQFAGNAAQKACEASIIALHSGSKTAAVVGVVSFPSFHVIWAVLSARALWPIRGLRIVGVAMAGLVVVSTVSTGWHYVVDVIAGFAMAAVALGIARLVVEPERKKRTEAFQPK